MLLRRAGDHGGKGSATGRHGGGIHVSEHGGAPIRDNTSSLSGAGNRRNVRVDGGLGPTVIDGHARVDVCKPLVII